MNVVWLMISNISHIGLIFTLSETKSECRVNPGGAPPTHVGLYGVVK